MKNSLIYFILGILTTWILLFLLFTKGCISSPTSPIITDTVYVDKPYKEIIIKEIEKEIPRTVYIHKVDTLYREQIEQDTLITSIEINRQEIKIHTLSPEGISEIKEYDLAPFKKLEIDHEGNLKVDERKVKRLKFWRNVERVGLVVVGVWIGERVID